MRNEFLVLADFMWFGPVYGEPFWEATKNDTAMYLEKIPLEQVTVPTHILHGDMDKDVDVSNAEKAHAAIKGSVFIKQEGGDHNTNFHKDFHEKHLPE